MQFEDLEIKRFENEKHFVFLIFKFSNLQISRLFIRSMACRYS